MKAIYLEKEKFDFNRICNLARTESVLLLTKDGEEFILSRADDFESEVEALRNSAEFQAFLDRRSQCKVKFALEDIEKKVDEELSAIHNP